MFLQAETIRMIKKPTAMDSFITTMHQLMHHVSHAEFFGKMSNHPDDSALLLPRLGTLPLLVFKTEITFEREEISDQYLIFIIATSIHII